MKKRAHILPVLFIIAAVLLIMYVDSNYRLVTEEYEIKSERFPKALSGLRVVHLTDMHNTEYGKDNSRFLTEVRRAEPDIICITGDIIDGTEANRDAEEAYVRRVISGLCEIAPVYYVSGNHEWASGWARQLFDVIRECGGTVLRNQYVVIGEGEDSFVLAGCDDPNGPRDMKTPAEVMDRIREREGDKYVLMLYHRHDRLDMWAETGVDAVLCGHAHGGMIRLPFTDGLYAPGQVFFPKNTSGLYEKDGTVELVSRGVGGPKYRFLNNPEIVVAIFEHG